MPELPEVEITKQGIEPFLLGQTIKRFTVRNRKLRWPIPVKLHQTLQNLVIQAVSRRGKYILIDCTVGWLIIHLGMSGSLRVLTSKEETASKHEHYDINLNNGMTIRYRDPRRFGALLWTNKDPEKHRLLTNLGPEPLHDVLNGRFLYQVLRKKSSPIKIQIMNNHIVTGVGNIYANESLFHAGIRPTRQANRISQVRLERLSDAIKKTLKRAIEVGGSSLQDFYQADGTTGYFQQEYKVYGRTGEPCHTCKTPIKMVTLGQRSSFYCIVCQT